MPGAAADVPWMDLGAIRSAMPCPREIDLWPSMWMRAGIIRSATAKCQPMHPSATTLIGTSLDTTIARIEDSMRFMDSPRFIWGSSTWFGIITRKKEIKGKMRKKTEN